MTLDATTPSAPERTADPVAAAPDVALRSTVPWGAQLGAWSVHLFTASGLLWATLATIALIDGDAKAMWGWLGIALFVDAVDGTLARRARVKEAIPWFDGGIMDIAVDYLTWTFIPAVFFALHLPAGPRPLAIGLTALILISSMFCYANTGWKSTDHYFVGFPAAWNIVVLMLYLLGTGAMFNTAAVVVLAIATLVPLHYTHPFRVKHLMVPNLLAVTAWGAGAVWLVAAMPERPALATILFYVGGGWLMLTGVLRSVLGAKRG